MSEPLIDLHSGHYFMGEALRQARRAAQQEEVPVGAVGVLEGADHRPRVRPDGGRSRMRRRMRRCSG